MPKQFAMLRDKNYLGQICGQVFYIERNIEEGKAAVAEERVYSVQYEELCIDPGGVLDRISDFIRSYGGNVKTKSEIPKSFKVFKYADKELSEEEKRMKDILRNYYKDEIAKSLILM